MPDNRLPYKILKDTTIEYNVGRDGIGLVQQFYPKGSIVKGNIQSDGSLRVLGIYSTPSKHYSTPLFLSPGTFAPTTETAEKTELYGLTIQDRTEYVMLGLGVWFGLMLVHDT
jgi:hypothetical protein